jgi:glyoxylase-like metal-dependent hydrolase (beta-lactamase superfamily II)
MITIYDGEREIQVIDMGPAHCQSDAIVYLPKEKVLFAGDLLIVGVIGPGIEKFWNGSINIIKVLNTLLDMDVKTYVPGHGSETLSREETVKIVSEHTEFCFILREEARRCFGKGMNYLEAFDALDWNKFKQWGRKEEQLGVVIKGNLATLWSEFKGNPPGTNVKHEGWVKSES